MSKVEFIVLVGFLIDTKDIIIIFYILNGLHPMYQTFKTPFRLTYDLLA